MWVLCAFGSAFFVEITSILAKCGIKKTDSHVVTVLRTIVVLFFSWLMVLVGGSHQSLSSISTRTWFFLIVSGLSTGASWLCYYKALQMGPASVVVPIDKLSLVVTVIFSYFAFHEKLNKKSLCGFICLIAGTLLMLL